MLDVVYHYHGLPELESHRMWELGVLDNLRNTEIIIAPNFSFAFSLRAGAVLILHLNSLSSHITTPRVGYIAIPFHKWENGGSDRRLCALPLLAQQDHAPGASEVTSFLASFPSLSQLPTPCSASGGHLRLNPWLRVNIWGTWPQTPRV